MLVVSKSVPRFRKPTVAMAQSTTRHGCICSQAFRPQLLFMLRTGSHLQWLCLFQSSRWQSQGKLPHCNIRKQAVFGRRHSSWLRGCIFRIRYSCIAVLSVLLGPVHAVSRVVDYHAATWDRCPPVAGLGITWLCWRSHECRSRAARLRATLAC